MGSEINGLSSVLKANVSERGVGIVVVMESGEWT